MLTSAMLYDDTHVNGSDIVAAIKRLQVGNPVEPFDVAYTYEKGEQMAMHTLVLLETRANAHGKMPVCATCTRGFIILCTLIYV